ncbi:hypothetical protein NDR87_36740 [Nocardia sp. CDC159]|uniref:MspA protein n=1 Tax=Nocardia pulmonis TaxID=2951408 RepID=A0A9X2J2C5_9NOCA|nr:MULTISPECIES: hypothetical protein [Nocardia]MCM6779035.1 hypothetical protein [Nocardia pulmonis]MCM6791925.1 hypothetical protein [Nocardia sp. CDC159]
MGIRAAAATLGIAAGLAAIAVSSGAGQAAALTLEVDPQLGVYGVDLNHSETVALHNSPVPTMLDGVWRDHGTAFLVPMSAIYAEDDEIYVGDLSEVVAEAAESPDGMVGLGIIYPGQADALPAGLLAVGIAE